LRARASRTHRAFPTGASWVVALGFLHQRRHRAADQVPPGSLRDELLATSRGERVDPDALAALRGVPRRGNPLLAGKSMECGIERARFDAKDVAGAGLDHLHEAVPVPGPPAERLEDDQVERSLEELQPGRGGFWHDSTEAVDALYPRV